MAILIRKRFSISIDFVNIQCKEAGRQFVNEDQLVHDVIMNNVKEFAELYKPKINEKIFPFYGVKIYDYATATEN